MNVRTAPSPLWFVLPLVGAYATAFFIVEVIPRAHLAEVVSIGLTIDLVVFLPALFYIVLVRGRGWPVIWMAPVILLSYGAAVFLVPADHHSLLRMIGYMVPAIELGLVGYVAFRMVKAVRSRRVHGPSTGDFYDRTRGLLNESVAVPVVARVLAYEISVFHYAFFARASDLTEGHFSYHRRGGYGTVFAAILMAASVELVAIHFLLSAWSPLAATIHLILAAYGIVWLVGDYRAIRHRHHELGSDALRIRLGLRWDVAISWDDVEIVRRTKRDSQASGYLNAVPVGSPQYVVQLRSPATASGPFGLTREVSQIGIAVDETDAFEDGLIAKGISLT